MDILKIKAVNVGALADVEIDLSDVELASITGPNGAGKSTLFTTIPVFTLFGKTKNGCSLDDMIRTGETSCMAELEFSHNGSVYRVTRTRSKEGRGKSTLELNEQVGSEWISRSAETIEGTQEEITAMLNMEHDTFISSSMILQGNADEFTSKPPGQRKAILSHILGLEVYNRLHEKVKAELTSITRQLENMKTQRETYLSETAGKSRAIEEVQTRESQLEQHYQQMNEIKDSITGIERDMARLKEKIIENKYISTEKERLVNERESSYTVRNRINDKIKNHEAILDTEKQLNSAKKEYDHAVEQVKAMETANSQIQEQKNKLDRLTRHLHSLKTEVKDRQDKINRLETSLQKEAEINEAVSREKVLKEIVADLEERKNRTERLNKKINDVTYEYNQEHNSVTTREREIEKDLDILHDKETKMLNSECVDIEKAKVAPCVFLRDAAGSQEKAEKLRQELLSIDKFRLETLKGQQQQLDQDRNNLNYDMADHEEKSRELARVSELAREKNYIEEKKILKADYIKEQKSITSRIADLDEEQIALESDIEKLQNGIKDLDKYNRTIQQNKGIDEKLEELNKSRSLLPEEKIALAEEEKRIGEISNLIFEVDGKIAELGDAEKEYRNKEQERDVATLAIQDKEKQISLTLQAVGSWKKQLEIIEQKEKEVKDIDRQMKPVSDDIANHLLLQEAFSKNGIPALIIENAIPELENISNSILSDMSKGRHSLKFQTQVERKTSKKMAETLDIIISDWHGERPYETFSGGEQLRINFAIRFALAELMAKRAGAKIDFLIIDEGLGSQDKEHRDLVIEAIRNVSDRFKKVLVITHIEDTKDVFPQQISFQDGEVVKEFV